MAQRDHPYDPSCPCCLTGLAGPAVKNTIEAQVEKLIDQHGFTVISVQGGTPDNSFAYTVGLAPHGWPELILTSLGQSSAQMILNEAVKKLRADTVKPAAGMTVTEAVNFPLKLGPVARRHLRAHLRVANERARRLRYAPRVQGINRSLPALQVIWPDPAGRYPGEPGYDELNFPQKLLDV